MSRKFHAAAIQMDAAPAPTEDRLHRAEQLISQAAQQGAKLVALTELFNTGYEYSDDLYLRAERMDGITVTWMKRSASQYGVHLAGTLLIADGDHVYNRAVLVAPDGRLWTYDKNYPWAFERAYYRDGRTITVADTDLGRIGLMICWDYAHADLWQRYAGRVNLMLVMSCPPTLASGFSGAIEADMSKMYFKGTPDPFGADLDAQTGWLGVPLIHTSGSGHLKTKIPRAGQVLFGFALMGRFNLLSKLREAPDMVIESDYYHKAKIVDAQGKRLAEITTPGDSVVVSEITVNDYPPTPEGEQPAFNMKRLAYWMSDALTPFLMNPLYREGYRKRFGKNFAPIDASTKRWRWALAFAFFVGTQFGGNKAEVKIESKK